MTEHIRILIEQEMADKNLRNPFTVECEFFKEYQRKYRGFFVTATDTRNQLWTYLFVFGGNIDEDHNMYVEQIYPIM